MATRGRKDSPQPPELLLDTPLGGPRTPKDFEPLVTGTARSEPPAKPGIDWPAV